MTARRRAAAVAFVLALSCGGAPPAPAPSPPAARAMPAALVAPPVRYVLLDAAWIERTAAGVDRFVADGRRVEARGAETERLGPAEPEVQGGAVAPAWAGGGPSRYVFWKGRELYGSEGFAGELHRTASLPAEPRQAFDWFGGTGLILTGGAVVVPPGGGPPAALPVPGVVAAAAADARLGLVADVLGHAWLTLDGGASFRDVTSELGRPLRVAARGEAIVVTLEGGRERAVDASGGIADARPGGPLARGRPLPERIDAWPGPEGALAAAARSGLPLPDGGAVITAGGFVGRLDLATLRTTSVAPLGEAAAEAECAAFRAADAVLLACSGPERATLFDVTGAPRVERSFEVDGKARLDRFAGVDGEAIGFLGPCTGHAPALPAEREGVELANPSPGRSPVFCVRAGRDEWIEHRLDAADAADVIAWIPRPAGGAVALVGRAGAFLAAGSRITVRGGLRVVRVARNEPPLALPRYTTRSPEALDRALRVGADDAIEGFLPASGLVSTLGVRVDAAGRVRAFPGPPRASQIFTAGAVAIALSEDGKTYETVDRGRTWAEILPPPGAPSTSPTSCSPVGCRFGSFVRLGWSADAASAVGPDPGVARAKPPSGRGSLPAPPAVVELECAYDGPPVGRRTPESFSFGVTPAAQPRSGGMTRLGTQGVAAIPWNGGQPVLQGDIDFSWIPPLDPAAPVKRRAVSMARVSSAPSRRSYEMKLGYLLAEDGGVELLPIARREACLGELLEAAGIARWLGACAEDRAVGVELGGRAFVIHPGADGLRVSAADAPRVKEAAARKGAPRLLPSALRELWRVRAGGSARGFNLGAGARDGAPVVVVVDALGGAALAAIDPESGALGAEERLRPLGEAALGSEAACAGGARPGEARVVLPFESAIGLDRAALPGVFAAGTAGVAVLRWSRDRACVDAVELAVRDERYEVDLGPYDPPGTVRKLIGRFTGAAGASLVLITSGTELRQKLACRALAPGKPMLAW